MLPTAIIVFREVLEAALIVGIVMAASRGALRRGRWVSGGIVAGVLGACGVAAFAATIAAAAEGMGQELFDAGILFAAVGMLGWHNIWMSRHGRELAGSATQLGNEVRSGARPLWALAFAVALAVLREGSEIVLFLYGIALGGNGGPLAMAIGGVIGLALGVAAGSAIYWGLVSIPMRLLFTMTSWLVLLLAAGLASQGAAFLMQADLLPPLGSNLWDTSFLLSDQSLPGRILHTLIGYTAQPAGIQLVFYAATLLVIGGLMRLVGADERPAAGNPAPRRGQRRPLAKFFEGSCRCDAFATKRRAASGRPRWLLGALAALPAPALADFKVQLPDAETGEFELEEIGSYGSSGNLPATNNEQSFVTEFGYGVTNWWHTELELETFRPAGPGNHLTFNQMTSENVFAFTERGEYWLDPGFFWEYGQVLTKGNAERNDLWPDPPQGGVRHRQYGKLVPRKGAWEFRRWPAEFQLRLGNAG